MPKELTEDTLEALEKQSGTSEPIDDKEESTLPDIELGEGDKPKEGQASFGDNEPDKEPEDDTKKTELSKTLVGAGYTDEDITKRITEDGGVSDEFLEELKDKVDPDFLESHVGRIKAEFELAKFKAELDPATVKAKEEATQKMNEYIFKTVGGEDKFSIMGKALKDNVSTEDLAAINAKLASGNITVVREGLELAVKKYNNIRGMGGKLMEGDAGFMGEQPEHITKEEYRALMKTDKYKTDPKYAQKIDKERLRTRSDDSSKYGHGQYFGYHPDKGRYAL